jgi:hypothetical protein
MIVFHKDRGLEVLALDVDALNAIVDVFWLYLGHWCFNQKGEELLICQLLPFLAVFNPEGQYIEGINEGVQ